jgi:hypothetical protein
VRVDDPDGIVVDAEFVDPGACGVHLATCRPWVREPLGEWLAERWSQPRHFRYLIDGDDPARAVVTRR